MELLYVLGIFLEQKNLLLKANNMGKKHPRFLFQKPPWKAVDVAVLEGLRSMRLRKRPIMSPKEARGTLTNQGWEVGTMEGWHRSFWWT